jgi:hypothetical protein
VRSIRLLTDEAREFKVLLKQVGGLGGGGGSRHCRVERSAGIVSLDRLDQRGDARLCVHDSIVTVSRAGPVHSPGGRKVLVEGRLHSALPLPPGLVAEVPWGMPK